jgi:hypothetical protein
MRERLENQKKMLPSNGADSPSVTLKIHLHSSCSSPLLEGVYTEETILYSVQSTFCTCIINCKTYHIEHLKIHEKYKKLYLKFEK